MEFAPHEIVDPGFAHVCIHGAFRAISLYAATKAGAEALMLAWADEIETTPIRISVLDPGRMRTQMRAQAFPGEDPETLTHPSEIGPLVVELARGDLTPALRTSFKEWKAGLKAGALIRGGKPQHRLRSRRSAG